MWIHHYYFHNNYMKESYMTVLKIESSTLFFDAVRRVNESFALYNNGFTNLVHLNGIEIFQ